VTRYAVRHETSYGYSTSVDIGLHLLRLTPLEVGGQRPLSHTLTIPPQPTSIDTFVDHFGNLVHYVAVESVHDRFVAAVEAEVEISRSPVSDEGPMWEEIRDQMRNDGFPVAPRVAEFVYASSLAHAEQAATAYALESFNREQRIVPALRDLMARIHNEFTYTPNLTNVSTRIDEVLSLRQGVCQDFAHLMIAGLRGLGLPARYVSGYVYTRSVSGEAARPGSDASHAWISA
jgi:transglutaminase-like putative cysteine protease